MTLNSEFTGVGITVKNSLAYGDGGMVWASDSGGTNTVKVTLQG